jgi:1-deoxy-D-xylulose-5-phosphate synthase
VFGKTLVELAEKNPKIVGITPAMLTGCSMTFLQEKFPERTFDVGIAEQHAVTFSAGLATQGLVPFCNIYSSFLQRAIDQIIHDVALQNLPVIFCLDRAGLVGEDGATHHGFFDLALLRNIPNLIIAAPLNEIDLRNLMYTAQFTDRPFVIRYPRGKGTIVDWQKPMEIVEIGKGVKIIENGNLITNYELGITNYEFHSPGGRNLNNRMQVSEANAAYGKKIAIVSIGAIGQNAINAVHGARFASGTGYRVHGVTNRRVFPMWRSTVNRAPFHRAPANAVSRRTQ